MVPTISAYRQQPRLCAQKPQLTLASQAFYEDWLKQQYQEQSDELQIIVTLVRLRARLATRLQQAQWQALLAQSVAQTQAQHRLRLASAPPPAARARHWREREHGCAWELRSGGRRNWRSAGQATPRQQPAASRTSDFRSDASQSARAHPRQTR